MSITKISPDVVDFDAGITISTTDNTSNLILTSTDADANAGPVLELYRNSSSPADNDEIGRIYFYGENDNDEKIEYGLIRGTIVDASDGTEDSALQIYTYSGGGQRNRIDLLAGETVFNEGSQDIDTRIETDGDTHRLFVDAGNNRVLIGTTASRTMSGVTPDFFIEGTAYSDSSIGAVINANGQIDCPALFFGKSRGTSLGSNTVVQDGDRLFSMRIDGSDGTNLEQAAIIEVYVDGTVANNSIPGHFRFMTTTVGSQYATEKMRIDNAGDVTISDGNLIVASGHGIDFSATANEGNVYSELFDDYEEGHIEPTVTGSASGTYTLSSTGNSYAYTKIGQRVFISGYLTITGGSGTGQLRVSMPFTAATMTDDQGYSFGSGLVQNNGNDITGQKYAFVSDAATYFDFYQVNDSGSSLGLPCSSLDTSFQIGFDFSFIAA